MKRRNFFRSFAAALAIPFVGKLAIAQKSTLLKHVVEKMFTPDLPSLAWQTEANIRKVMQDSEPCKRQHPTFPPPENPDWQYWDNYHRTMSRYEGFVDVGDSQTRRMWRFNRISETELKCALCPAVIVVNRDVMREHGKVCNSDKLPFSVCGTID